jgi:hypothetical protein
VKSEAPADVAITRTIADGGQQIIYSCWSHAGHVTRHLQAQCGPGDTVTTGRADPAKHGCKGHLEDWPAS